MQGSVLMDTHCNISTVVDTIGLTQEKSYQIRPHSCSDKDTAEILFYLTRFTITHCCKIYLDHV